MDEALSPEQFEALVERVKKEKCPRKRLEITATISRQLYDAEKTQLSLLRGASILDPVFKGLEIERRGDAISGKKKQSKQWQMKKFLQVALLFLRLEIFFGPSLEGIFTACL